ncbi:hypothetical protein AB1N83_007635 [Pleurotus pulmonarius]
MLIADWPKVFGTDFERFRRGDRSNWGYAFCAVYLGNLDVLDLSKTWVRDGAARYSWVGCVPVPDGRRNARQCQWIGYENRLLQSTQLRALDATLPSNFMPAHKLRITIDIGVSLCRHDRGAASQTTAVWLVLVSSGGTVGALFSSPFRLPPANVSSGIRVPRPWRLGSVYSSTRWAKPAGGVIKSRTDVVEEASPRSSSISSAAPSGHQMSA